MTNTVYDLTGIAVALIALLFALAWVFLIPLFRAKISGEKLGYLRQLVSIGVYSAEQIFKGTGLGAKKKEYVLAFLEKHGMTADLDIIDNAIEAEVCELKRKMEEAGMFAPAVLEEVHEEKEP